jgi:hypothetical protein
MSSAQVLGINASEKEARDADIAPEAADTRSLPAATPWLTPFVVIEAEAVPVDAPSACAPPDERLFKAARRSFLRPLALRRV